MSHDNVNIHTSHSKTFSVIMSTSIHLILQNFPWYQHQNISFYISHDNNSMHSSYSTTLFVTISVFQLFILHFHEYVSIHTSHFTFLMNTSRSTHLTHNISHYNISIPASHSTTWQYRYPYILFSIQLGWSSLHPGHAHGSSDLPINNYISVQQQTAS